MGVVGSQIDLLIARLDRVTNICEMKYASSGYAITKAYERSLRDKVNGFQRVTGSKAPYI